MRLTVTTLSDQIFVLEVRDDMELENFKAMCAEESGVPSAEIALLWNGRPLHDDKFRLKDYGLTDGEMVLLQRIQPAMARLGGRGNNPAAIDFGNISVPEAMAGGSGAPGGVPMGAGTPGEGLPAPGGRMANPDDPATIRQMLLASPHDLAILKERNPPLADALLSGSLERFTEVLRKQQEERAQREQDRIRMMNADPFDPDVQQKIAEEIRLKNVESNMETAMEYAPESFGQVVMLYIDCKVNGSPVKAFVDSGAQMTIMSQACAERCNIMRLVDTRWAGIAKGVGTQKIIGRVHLCQIQIGPDFLQSSFSILEDQPMDMLLGLDMLKRHQCILDLKNGRLEIGTTGTKTPFLSEAEVPEHARLNRSEAATDQADEDRQLAEALAKSANEANKPGTSGTPAAPSSSSSTAAASSPYPEADVKRLTDYGFPRHQVLEELQQAAGNVDQALGALFAKSFHVP